MNFIKNIHLLVFVLIVGTLSSCDDYLHIVPQSQVTPESYFNDEGALCAYANARYSEILPSHANWSYGLYGADNNTDNMTALTYDGKYVVGKWKTSMDDGGYNFSNINTINYFFDCTLQKFENGQITGSETNISHYIGEMYFFRAFEYFKLLMRYGDFPIIKTTLPDDLPVLIEASKRSPRNEVARFILSDLDKAYELLSKSTMSRTRINADVVLLFKSRVALFEGSWLKNFESTAFVPCTDEWPGKSTSYNINYNFPSGSIEDEYKWFFEQAMESAKIVADANIGNLTENTGVVPHDSGLSLNQLEAQNPWLAMFGTTNLSAYNEVLLWREYSDALNITHNVVHMAQKGNCNCGTTRGMVDAFIMKNGLPIYANGSNYHGDKTISDVRQDRDPRLNVLLKEPGQKNVLLPGNNGYVVPIEPIPDILNSNTEECYTTGYTLRKGNNYDPAQANNGRCFTACPIFRSVEALLNYIEASYELSGEIDATADRYWRAIRARNKGLEQNYNITIEHTNMAEEAKGDWGAYTAGELIDPIRYNIRRERRCELMAEGFRWMDLIRWRSLDQMITTGYHIEGIHIWNTPMEGWYDSSRLADAISPRSLSEYLRPHEAEASSEVKDGLKWTMAHYLCPLPIKQMMLTSPDGITALESPIYQNPYWPSEPNLPATK